MKSITKIFHNYPFAHRQPSHPGHCRLIHGHNWSFEVTFACEDDNVDQNGFVLDFGQMQPIKEFLKASFDHTLVINHEDLEFFAMSRKLEELGFASIVRVPNCGAEGLAEYVYDEIAKLLPDLVGSNSRTVPFGTGEDGSRLYDYREVYLMSVTVYEDDKNSATHLPLDAAYYKHSEPVR